MQYVYLKNTPEFTLKTFRGKSFKKWDAENKKMLSSYEQQQGYKVEFSFELENGDVLGLSRDQLSQALVGAFENQKPLLGTTFNAKDNGKQGLEKRWFVNVKFSEAFKKPERALTNVNLIPKKEEITTEEVEKIFGEDPAEPMPEWLR